MPRTFEKSELTGGFSDRLAQVRKAKGWSQSDLARLIWGVTTTSAGHEVAKNRDRISAYESGRAKPNADNLERVAEAVGLSVEELAPDLVVDDVFANPDPRMDIRLGADGHVYIRVNARTTLSVANKIADMLGVGANG